MMKKFRHIAAILIVPCFSIFSGCSSDDTVVSGNTEEYIHSGSKIPFPAELGSFVRQRVDEAAPDESGVTAEYSFRKAGSHVSITVLVYRNPDADLDAPSVEQGGPQWTEAQAARLEEIEEEIIAEGTDDEHRFVAAYDIAIERDGKPFFGKRAFFRDRDEAFSNAYLFEYGEWFVEYRTVFDRDLEWVAEKFVTDHSWGEIEKTEES